VQVRHDEGVAVRQVRCSGGAEGERCFGTALDAGLIFGQRCESDSGGALLLLVRGGPSPRKELGSVQSFSHIWFGLSGARHWLKR
jgi:hypothetical protein